MEIKAIIKIIFVLLASCTIRTQCQEENKYLRDLLLIDRIAGAHFKEIIPVTKAETAETANLLNNLVDVAVEYSFMEQEIELAGDDAPLELLATQALVKHTIDNTCVYIKRKTDIECNMEVLINLYLRKTLEPFRKTVKTVSLESGGAKNLGVEYQCDYYNTTIATDPSLPSEVNELVEKNLKCSLYIE